MFKTQQKTDAVSPVIGVILLVAVTVALVALATVIVFDIGSDVSDTADATVQLEQISDSVQATVIRNENVDTFTLTSSEENVVDVENFSGDVGTTASFPTEGLDEGEDAPSEGTASVIANLEDGSQEVLTSTDYNVTE